MDIKKTRFFALVKEYSNDIVELCIYPLNNFLSKIRFWCDEKLIDIHKVKNNVIV